jgi:hypothetical protein
MNMHRIAGVLALFAASLLLSAQSAWADCDNDNDCTAPYTQCVNAQCINPSCPPPPPVSSVCVPSGGVDDVLFNTNCCSGSAVPGSTCCRYWWDWGGSWSSCSQICA